MPLTATTTSPTTAETLSARYWAGNLRALAVAQPQVVERLQSMPLYGEWVLARDGALTLLDAAGAWIGGCSLPYRAAVAMLQSLDPRGTVACFLAPLHAAEIRASLERFSVYQSVIVLQPDWQTLRTMLACEDFSAAIAAGRLVFAAGEDWSTEFRAIFARHPGLPTPQQFIKLPTLTNETVDPLIAESQKIFSDVITARADRIGVLRDAPRRQPNAIQRIGVIAGSRFALWDDASAALAEALRPASPSPSDASIVEVSTLDPDLPLFASPLATAEFCTACDVLVTADTARSDFPNVLPLNLPWVTWVTKPRMPLAAGAGPNDALLIADPSWKSLAINAGWTADRVDVAQFNPPTAPASQHGVAFDGWTVIADTLPIAMPEALEEFSSHRLVWERIAEELTADPFAVGEDLTAYLHKRCQAASVDDAALDRRLFIDSLILPAYQQGIVRALLKDRQPIRAFGSGWDQIDEFRAIAARAITTRDELASVIASSRRLVHVWPIAHAHPIEAIALPLLKRTLSRLDSLVQQARRPEKAPTPSQPAQPISLDRVFSMLNRGF